MIKKEKNELKPRRIFSDSFKREKVRMLENNEIRIGELCRLYNVSSTSVYRWKRKYGTIESTERIVVEKESDQYRSSKLLKHIKELESKVGRQQMELDYYTQVILEANKLYDVDIEKKLNIKLL